MWISHLKLQRRLNYKVTEHATDKLAMRNSNNSKFSRYMLHTKFNKHRDTDPLEDGPGGRGAERWEKENGSQTLKTRSPPSRQNLRSVSVCGYTPVIYNIICDILEGFRTVRP